MKCQMVGVVVALLMVASIFVGGCGGSDGINIVDAARAAIVMSVEDIGTILTSAGGASAKVVAVSDWTLSCAGTAANPYPCVLNATVDEVMSCGSGTRSYTGTLKVTLSSPTASTSTFTLNVRFSECGSAGYTYGNALRLTGTMSGDITGNIDFDMKWVSSDFSINGELHVVDLTITATAQPDGSVSGLMSGNIDDIPVIDDKLIQAVTRVVSHK